MLNYLLSQLFTSKLRTPARTRLHCEHLEARDCPVVSVLDVNSLLDTPDVAGDNKWEDANGNKTLRAAIEYSSEVNAALGINRIRVGNYDANRYDIVFVGQAVGGTITLTNVLQPKSNLNIRADIPLVIERDPDNVVQFRLFDFVSGTETRLFQLTLQNGWSGAGGGAIFSGGKLVVAACNFRDNHANASGGAISADGAGAHLTVTNSFFWYNEAYRGGAISAVSTTLVSISDSDIFANSAVTFAGQLGKGGGLFFMLGSAPILANTRIYGNSATGSGGGIHVLDVGCSITNGEVHGNTAGGYGGGVFLTKETEVEITLTLTNVKLTNNRAGQKGGGADAAKGKMNLSFESALFTGNTAVGGIDGAGYKKTDATATLTLPPNPPVGTQNLVEDP